MITPASKSFHATMMSREPYMNDGFPNRLHASEIAWDLLTPVNAGGYGFVFKTEQYAVKIGNVSVYDALDLLELSKIRRAPPAYAYWLELEIPESFVINHGKPVRTAFGAAQNIRNYLRKSNDKYFADVMVVALAQPVFTVKTTRDEEKKLMRSARYLYNLLADQHNYSWGDAHVGNLGKIGNRLVVLDT